MSPSKSTLFQRLLNPLLPITVKNWEKQDWLKKTMVAYPTRTPDSQKAWSVTFVKETTITVPLLPITPKWKN